MQFIVEYLFLHMYLPTQKYEDVTLLTEQWCFFAEKIFAICICLETN